MAYFHFLAAWSNQDIVQIKKIISHDIKATFINNECEEIVMDYDGLIDLLQQRFESDQEWDFEVIYNAQKSESSIVVVEITRENNRHELIEDKALCTLFFRKGAQFNNLVRLDMVMGIKHTI
ncbi:hypothetical protein BHU61_06035 [Macrococcus epidermidis]|uniref:SnoaL-like domain-containing protein n=1 Tax=Macrococcus epidermidis TaxID=1902580 RepID=A0A328A0U3_9STAP|nr:MULTISPECIES: hypothetical protein [Macrococcus]MCH4984058.1 hypothetical protein [Macrococcus sp. PK]RAK47018.1 hypothetical protein BHU61_06035 [Macrococcus epidermidis]